MIDLTIFTVATGRYLDFWIDLVNSGEEFIGNSVMTHWLVLTDQGEKIPPEILNRLGSRLSVVPISHEPWPNPTLKRYEYLLFAKDKITSDYIMHLDADMVFVDYVNDLDITKPLAESEIACVSHPGFFRPRGSERIKFYGRNPRKFIQDVKLFLKFGGIGTWEKSASSTAFVPRALRRQYVCGGCWFGTKRGILKMAESLQRNIEIDLQSDFIANFHDESHLNAFISDKKNKILTPEFCFDPSYPQLKDISPKLLAVDKNQTTVWVRE
jgi:hypothetical protein